VKEFLSQKGVAFEKDLEKYIKDQKEAEQKH
jgi:hypothetical protein